MIQGKLVKTIQKRELDLVNKHTDDHRESIYKHPVGVVAENHTKNRLDIVM